MTVKPYAQNSVIFLREKYISDLVIHHWESLLLPDEDCGRCFKRWNLSWSLKDMQDLKRDIWEERLCDRRS